jgi:hypothetical protein
MGAGTPKFNAYVGSQLVATPLVNADNSAIYCGPLPSVGQSKKVAEINLLSTNASNNVPLSMILCDYLLFYPLIDGDDSDVQNMDNTATLPRYQDGEGVQAFLVTTSPMTANGTATITYTNSEGVSGRVLTTTIVASSTLGPIAHRQSNANGFTPFIGLAAGDRGIRSVESVQFPSAVGGFVALVLVKPLAQTIIREANTPNERPMFLTTGGVAPAIADGAFLNFIFSTSGNASPAIVRGHVGFVWG